MASTMDVYFGEKARSTKCFWAVAEVVYDKSAATGNKMLVNTYYAIYCESSTQVSGSGKKSWESSTSAIGGGTDTVTYNGKKYYRSGRKLISSVQREGGSKYTVSASCWYTGSSGTTYKSTLSKEVPIPSLVETYTVSYNANGGAGAPEAQTKVKDVALTLSATTPTLAKKRFAGWATTAGGSVAYQPSGTYTGNANLTLYAVWRDEANIYYNDGQNVKGGTLYYNDNGTIKAVSSIALNDSGTMRRTS